MRFLPVLPLFFSVFLVIGYGAPQKNSQKPLICKNLATLSRDFKQESERVMAAIRAEFGIEKSFWDRYMHDFKCLIGQDRLLCKKAPKSTPKQLIPRVLQEHGIDIKRVHIQKVDGDNQAEAFQDIEDERIIHRLSINFDWLKTKTTCQQEAIIRHEIQHLLNYDPIEEMYIRWILIDMGYTEDNWKNSTSMTDYYHLRELRADAFACAKSKDMAQSLHDYFCDTMCLNEDREDWYSHPRDTFRAHQLAFLHNLDSNYFTQA